MIVLNILELKMLHDLLYALNGYPGSIFKETLGKFEIIPSFLYISRNEEAALNYLLNLGSKYLTFQKFIQAHSKTLVCDKNSHHFIDGLQYGCYLKAFCIGLDEVLNEYRNTLLELEKEIVADSHQSLLHIQQKTEMFHSLFTVIYDIISTIKTKKSHGCQILNHVHRSSFSGNPFIRKNVLIILSSCQSALYKQLSNWLVYGLLIDQHSEFFIVSAAKKDLQCSSKNSLSCKVQNDMFEVDINFLPNYISLRVAKVICFIGSSLHLFEHNQSFYKNIDIIQEQSVDILHIQEILTQNQEEFLTDIHQLQQAKEFIVEDFEVCIDKIRRSVAKELWKLCVEQGKLISYIKMLKDLMLLGRGELFLAFIDEVGSLLKNPPSRVTGHDVQQIFLRSSAEIQSDDELQFQLFQLTINSSLPQKNPFANLHFVDNGWARLQWTFKMKWPLHTIFKPNVMEKYNHLFQFLLKVKRIQSALHKVWSIQMRKQQVSDASNNQLTNISLSTNLSTNVQCQCRSQMQFFVDNLQYYLQADVLESHFSHLLKKIQKNSDSDFESITIAHDNFINALLSQCFVMSGVVCTSLIEILDLCEQFCDVIVTSSLNVSKEEVNEQINMLWKLYLKKTYLFFQVLNGVCSSQCNPHISQLTLRLDYNRYYSETISKSMID